MSANIILGQLQEGARAGIAQLPAPAPLAQTFVETAATAQPTAAASLPDETGKYFWDIDVKDVTAWVKIGVDAVAVVGEGWRITDGNGLQLAAVDGHRVSVIFE